MFSSLRLFVLTFMSVVVFIACLFVMMTKSSSNDHNEPTSATTMTRHGDEFAEFGFIDDEELNDPPSVFESLLNNLAVTESPFGEHPTLDPEFMRELAEGKWVHACGHPRLGNP